MKVNVPIASLALALICGMAVSACNEEEQGRPLSFEKGVYGGQPDSELSEATRKELRARTENMR